MMKSYKTISEYIGSFPPDVRKKLREIRLLIRRAAPGATEAIRYGIPTLRMKGNLVHFAAYKDHIGFYPGAEAMRTFTSELKGYETAKGTLRIPLDRNIPVSLLRRIVRYRVKKSVSGD